MWKFNKNDNFVKLFAFSEVPACVLMKKYQYGDLRKFIAGKGRVSKRYRYSIHQVVALFRQLCDAIRFMHSLGVVHADIKPPNILLDQDRNKLLIPIVTDFGVSRIVTGTLLTVRGFQVSFVRGGSHKYCAPEVWFRLRSKIETTLRPDLWFFGDTYALAVTLLEMMSRQNSWETK